MTKEERDGVVAQHRAIELTDAQRNELVLRIRKAEHDPASGVSCEDLDAELARDRVDTPLGLEES